MSLYEAQNARYSLEEKFMDSHHSMEGCLLDIVHSAKEEKEREVIQPSLMRQIVYLVINYLFSWTIAWIAVYKQDDHDFLKAQVQALAVMAAAGPGLSAFVVQWFYDGQAEGVMKLVRRCHPNMITKPWWVGSFLLIPCTLSCMSGVYVWFGGTPPEVCSLASFLGFFLMSIPIAIGEEIGWRGMMLPDTQNVIDGWYFAAYGNTPGNDGVAFWESRAVHEKDDDDLRAGLSMSAALPGTSVATHSAIVNTLGAQRGSMSASMNARNLMQSVQEAEDEEEESLDGSMVLTVEGENNDPPHWKWSPTLASLFIGFVWGTWYVPAFFINSIHHKYCNFFQYLMEQQFLSMFYTWQSNNTKGSILAAIITHSLQQTFRGLNPWGDTVSPSFFALPNSLYQLELLLLCCALLWTVGPELGRETNVVKKFVPHRNR